MVLHESQSLLLEMQACRSDAFLSFAAPRMRAAFGREGPAWTADNIHRVYTRVAPGFIRVDADEVTYPLHIMLRYRLERAMLAGDLKLADLPGAWNEGMRELLGIVPTDDGVGCLQDIHWSAGLVGYFPNYAMGALLAAQLFERANADDPAILPALARGDFGPYFAWARPRLHERASLVSFNDLVTEATGRPLSADAFKRHVRRRYLEEPAP